ncbi:hypothetical protein DY000_02039975 [Brassica cretica]|uniref:Uncharacterized protein n=1 Tax=Brassica cretica TaxID=69181 RepID=A0ABQ7BCK7_BRACR|nr:hypothetical protein DY000_02039975 [Brassica cretica]
MQPEACGMTHRRLCGESLLAGVFYIYSAPLLVFIDPEKHKDVGQYIQDIDVGFWELTSHYQDEDLEGIKGVWFLTSETPSELGKSDRSRCHFVDPRLETMSGLKPRGSSSSSLQVTASSNGTTKLVVPPKSPIEDRGTAILIEDRDREIPERLRLCGVVKGLPVSLMWRKNDYVGS